MSKKRQPKHKRSTIYSKYNDAIEQAIIFQKIANKDRLEKIQLQEQLAKEQQRSQEKSKYINEIIKGKKEQQEESEKVIEQLQASTRGLYSTAMRKQREIEQLKAQIAQAKSNNRLMCFTYLLLISLIAYMNLVRQNMIKWLRDRRKKKAIGIFNTIEADRKRFREILRKNNGHEVSEQCIKAIVVAEAAQQIKELWLFEPYWEYAKETDLEYGEIGRYDKKITIIEL